MPKPISIRQVGLYRLGNRIGVVHVSGDQYLFTSLDSNGVHSEVVDFMPEYVGLTWRDVIARMRSATAAVSYDQIQTEISHVADFLDTYVEEHYARYQSVHPKWVAYSERYDEIVVNWDEAPPVAVANAVQRYHNDEPLTALATYENCLVVIETLGTVNVPNDVFIELASATKKSITNYQDVAYLTALLTISYNAVLKLKKGEPA